MNAVEYGAAVLAATLEHLFSLADPPNRPDLEACLAVPPGEQDVEQEAAFEALVTGALESWALDRIHRQSFEALVTARQGAQGRLILAVECHAHALAKCTQQELGVREELCLAGGWAEAVAVLQEVNGAIQVSQKVAAVSTTIVVIERLVENISKESGKEIHLGADELLPILCFITAKAKLRHLLPQAEYMRFSFNAYHQAGGAADFALTMFEGAASYLESFTPESLTEDGLKRGISKDGRGSTLDLLEIRRSGSSFECPVRLSLDLNAAEPQVNRTASGQLECETTPGDLEQPEWPPRIQGAAPSPASSS